MPARESMAQVQLEWRPEVWSVSTAPHGPEWSLQQACAVLLGVQGHPSWAEAGYQSGMAGQTDRWGVTSGAAGAPGPCG